jgi:hypothetical protein
VSLRMLVRSTAALAAPTVLSVVRNGAAQDPAPAPVLVAIHAELSRSMDDLKRQPAPPYVVSRLADLTDVRLTPPASSHVVASLLFDDLTLTQPPETSPKPPFSDPPPVGR